MTAGGRLLQITELTNFIVINWLGVSHPARDPREGVSRSPSDEDETLGGTHTLGVADLLTRSSVPPCHRQGEASVAVAT